MISSLVRAAMPLRRQQRTASCLGVGFPASQNRTASSSQMPSEEVQETSQQKMRLIKRMSQLNLCSRREADRLIGEGRVLVDGNPATIGQKVDNDCTAIQILDHKKSNSSHKKKRGAVGLLRGAVVLNKPLGYVSGQPDHENVPAIRLLTRENFYAPANSETNVEWDLAFMERDGRSFDSMSWDGYAPAGRLDKDSSGLLVFTDSGVLAKNLIGSDHKIEKEYIVTVEPVDQVTRRERAVNPNYIIPNVSYSLKPFHRGGSYLMGDHRPLKACKANWIEHGRVLRIILREGRKQQIRRMCRELLGLHVIGLERVRIGPIELGDLPEGSWRALTKEEYEEIVK